MTVSNGFSRYTITEVRRPGRKGPRFLVAESGTPYFAVYLRAQDAEAALRRLQAGTAQFCPTCGRWVVDIPPRPRLHAASLDCLKEKESVTI